MRESVVTLCDSAQDTTLGVLVVGPTRKKPFINTVVISDIMKNGKEELEEDLTLQLLAVSEGRFCFCPPLVSRLTDMFCVLCI